MSGDVKMEYVVEEKNSEPLQLFIQVGWYVHSHTLTYTYSVLTHLHTHSLHHSLTHSTNYSHTHILTHRCKLRLNRGSLSGVKQ